MHSLNKDGCLTGLQLTAVKLKLEERRKKIEDEKKKMEHLMSKYVKVFSRNSDNRLVALFFLEAKLTVAKVI